MIKKRALKYLFLIAISIAVPYFMAFLLILITGNRINGMSYFIFPSLILIHLIFSFTQVKSGLFKKVLFGVVAGIFSVTITWVMMSFDLSLGIDIYGYWDLIIFNAVGVIGGWELLYQIDRVVVRK